MRKLFLNISLFASILSTILFQSCTNSFDELNTNPDKPLTVTPGMLATTLILDHAKGGFSDAAMFYEKRMFWGEQADGAQYNRFGNGSFGGIQSLTNAQKMMELATGKYKDSYTALYYYFKGTAFYKATMNMGDIPYSQALQSGQYLYPAYDAQKDVFVGILKDLEMAEEYFSKATVNIDGDPFYGGDITKWRKASNLLRLKVLLNLQKRAEDTPELKVKETFAKIVSEGNIYENNADNLMVCYADESGKNNPMHFESTRSIELYAVSATMLTPMKLYKDYRLFYLSEPMQALTDTAYLPDGATLLAMNDWNAYEGIDVSLPFSDGLNLISAKKYCRINDIFRLTREGAPSMRYSYSDQCFVIAEGIERGWLVGNAKDYYNEGIRASFNFYKEYIGSEYNHGMNITDEYIAGYLVGEHVDYDRYISQTDRLKKIWMQMYLGTMFNNSYDGYYLWRRTGYPEFPVNPLSNLNDDKDKIPVRWLYPTSEVNYNPTELQNALDRQWGGAEDINKVMWLIK